MSEAYSDFASVYDQLMDNIPYDEWFNYIHGLLIEYGIKDGIVAELGCGTGTITEMLSNVGYDMIGIDNSDSMLDIANAKKADSNSSTLYLCQDMREFELYGTVAATVSLCDSINYITEPDELLQVFKLVNNYLDPKGIFIFDFHPRYYYKEIVADATIAEDRDDISFIWDNYYDDEENINELALSLFLKENLEDDSCNLYRKHEEFHFQRGYTLDEIKNLIKASGLELLEAYDAFTHTPATEECERIYIIAREQGK
ncbi:MAG: class I SAM-dependent methyltransferase [Lachnospiraceae bacterium]|nr:class I SAM-dependent methyltransferase [Lachnospiraceae bacterium]